MKQLFEAYIRNPVRDLNMLSFPWADNCSVPLLLTESIKIIRDNVNEIQEYFVERDIDYKE
jgi:hypothetical protein